MYHFAHHHYWSSVGQFFVALKKRKHWIFNKSYIYAQTFYTTVIYSSDLFTHIACLHDQNKSGFLEGWLLSNQSEQSEVFKKP